MKVRGVVKGKTIVLDSAAGLTDGQMVEVEVRTVDDEDRTADRSNGNDDGWTFMRLSSDRFESLSEKDLSEVKITVTVVDADD